MVAHFFLVAQLGNFGKKKKILKLPKNSRFGVFIMVAQVAQGCATCATNLEQF